MSSPRRLAPTRAAILSGLWATTGWLLLGAGDGELAVPLGSLQDLRIWLDGVDPAVLAAALLRLLALGLCSYLLLATSLALLISLAGWRQGAAAACRLLPRALRNAVAGGAGLGLTGTLLAPSLAGATAAEGVPDPARVAVMVKLAEGDATSPSPAPTQPSAAAPKPSSPSGAYPPGRAQPPPTSGTHVVQAGESFWSIAREQLRAAVDPATADPGTTQIARYWHQLVEVNRERLVDRDDPDLLLPGQELWLP